MVERRESPRLPAAIDVVLNHRAQAVIGSVSNFSLSGAFVSADADLLPYGGPIELRLVLSTSGGEVRAVRLPATVRRLTDQGAGVSFGQIAREDYFSLVDLYVAGGRP